jgi:ferritin-like metal-binding protein YciE
MSDPPGEQLTQHLRDVHALEEQSLRQLERAVELAEDDELQALYKQHLEIAGTFDRSAELCMQAQKQEA